MSAFNPAPQLSKNTPSLAPKHASTSQPNNICYEIHGGGQVSGEIRCSGAKNQATKAMVACLLTEDPCSLVNMPDIGDVHMTEQLLRSLGAKLHWEKSGPTQKNTLHIDAAQLVSSSASFADSRSNRIPILLLPSLIHRLDEVSVPVVGGDGIGKRNVDFHIDALEKFGVLVEYSGDRYIARKKPNHRLQACHIQLPYPSVGATETCIFLGVLAEGTSVIRNVAIEPEIISLISMLSSMGAVIFLHENRELIIQGVARLNGTKAHIIGDRLEAASWAALACASNGKIKVNGVNPELLCNFLPYYNLIGGGYEIIGENSMEFFRRTTLKPISLETSPYPGFSTDYQQPFAVMLTQASGMSVIHETVYDNRFAYLGVIRQFGGNAHTMNGCLGPTQCRYAGRDLPHSAVIQGISNLISPAAAIPISDVRAGFAVLILGALAQGLTKLISADHLDRGYGNIETKFAQTNLKIRRYVI